MSNDAKTMSTHQPDYPKVGSGDKKVRILPEALTLLSTQGYVATSLADIIHVFDASKAGLPHHYSLKDRLLTAILDERDRRIVSRLPRLEEGAEAVLGAWANMMAHDQCHPDGVTLYTTMSAAVIDSKHRVHLQLRKHLIGAVSYLVDAPEHGKTAGEIREDASNEWIARHLVVISDRLQVQRLCMRADDGRTPNMHEVMAGVAVDMKERWLVHPE